MMCYDSVSPRVFWGKKQPGQVVFKRARDFHNGFHAKNHVPMANTTEILPFTSKNPNEWSHPRPTFNESKEPLKLKIRIFGVIYDESSLASNAYFPPRNSYSWPQ